MIGLIARADNTGLGVQSWEFCRHMAPDRTLIIDVGHLADDREHCNKTSHLDRYPDDAIVWPGWQPPTHVLAAFLEGLTAVYVAETPYNYALFSLAASMGVRVVLHYNWEFLEHVARPSLPAPAVFAAPSTWHYDDLARDNKILLPVPVATDRFTPRRHGAVAREFVHLVGRPAIHDRNGTTDVLAALRLIESDVTVTLKCQEPGHLERLVSEHYPRHGRPRNVDIVVDSRPVRDYWHNYDHGDVLVLPRRFGGLCLPVQEAMAAGMPTIMGDQSPNDDVLPGEWLIPAHRSGRFLSRSLIDLYRVDPVDLAARIDQFASDPRFYADALTDVAALATARSWATLRPEYDRALTG